jgi:hypothetical protein
LQTCEQYSASLRFGVKGSPQTAHGRFTGYLSRATFSRCRALWMAVRHRNPQAVCFTFRFAKLKTGRPQLRHGIADQRGLIPQRSNSFRHFAQTWPIVT